MIIQKSFKYAELVLKKHQTPKLILICFWYCLYFITFFNTALRSLRVKTLDIIFKNP